MVEPVSMSIGTIMGLVGLYSVCLQAMDQIADAKHFSHDSSKLHSLFECERFLFKEWGDKVRINDTQNPPHRCLDPNHDVYPVVRSLLESLQLIWADGDALSKRYGIESVGATQRKKLGLRQKVEWAVRDKKGFGLLVADVGVFIEKLYAILHGGDSDEMEAINVMLVDLMSFVQVDARQRVDEMVKQQTFRCQVTMYLSVQNRKALLDWVGAVSTERGYDDAIRARHPGTCTWLLRNETYLNWMGPPYGAGKTSPVLWVHGGPGTGKTFIAATAIEHLKGHSAYPTAFFICSHEDIAQNQPLAIVRSWIVQLARQRVEALKVLEKLKLDDPVATRVWDIFRTIIRDVGPCHLVLDGLDECLDYDPESKVSRVGSVKLFLAELLSSVWPERAKVLIVSRDIGDIRSGLLAYPQEGPQLVLKPSPMEYRIRIKDTDQDIQSIASTLVQSLKIKNTDKRDDTLQQLSGRCKGMFLWLRLAGERLKPGMRESKLTTTLQSMPTGLNQAYKRDLARVLTLDEEDQKWVKEILRWMLFSLRPLSITELFHALAIITESGIVQHHDIPDPDDQDAIQSQILDMCGSFIRIRRSRKYPDSIGRQTIHFVHFSAKQFLLNGSNELEEPKFQEFFFLTPATSHSILTESCLVYLLSDLKKYVKRRLYRYAAVSWMEHFHLSSIKGESRVMGLQRSLFMEGRSFNSWRTHIRIPELSRHPAPLEIASHNNLLDIAREILTNPEQFHPSGSEDFGLALYCAALRRDKEMAELLIAGGVNVNACDHQGRTALYIATLHRNHPMIKLLLARADVNVNVSDGALTPLKLAATGGDIEGARLLLARTDMDVNAGYQQEATLLHAAVLGGSIEMIQLLLTRKDLDVNEHRTKKITALHSAVVKGEAEVVQQLLVREDLDVNAYTEFDMTALHFAVLNGSIEVIRLLLARKDLDVNSSRGPTMAALGLAVGSGDAKVVDVLLGHEDVDVNASDEKGMTALHHAVSFGEAGMVKMLLERSDVDVNAGRENNMTPLHWAVLSSNPVVVQLLLARMDVDVNAFNEHVPTPLHYAVTAGNAEMVQQLLVRKHVDVNAFSTNRRTPLHYAVRRGNAELVQLLLTSQDVDVNACTVDKGTSLHIACFFGDTKIVQLLLARNDLDVNLRFEMVTPLFVAFSEGHMDVVKLLKARSGRRDPSGTVRARLDHVTAQAPTTVSGDHSDAVLIGGVVDGRTTTDRDNLMLDNQPCTTTVEVYRPSYGSPNRRRAHSLMQIGTILPNILSNDGMDAIQLQVSASKTVTVTRIVQDAPDVPTVEVEVDAVGPLGEV